MKRAAVILAVALAARLIHLLQMRDSLFFSTLLGDARAYDAWADRLAAGDWIGQEVFYQAPLYPYFLGLLYTIAGRDLLIVRAVQALVGAASCALLGYAGARLVSPAAGLAAGLALALYPPAIFFDGLVQKSVLDVFFVCLTLALIGRLTARGDDRRAWVALGLAMGGLTLTRENAVVLAACVLVWALAAGRGVRAAGPGVATARAPRRGRRARPSAAAAPSPRPLTPALLVAAGLAVVLIPVAARNAAVGGGFYLTTSQFGSNLYIGNHARADGSYVALRAGRGSPEYERVDATALAEQAEGRRLTPGEVSSYWTGRALAFVREEPGAWLALMARKARLLWSAGEIIDTESLESHAEHSWLLRATAFYNFGVLLPLAAIGMVALWGERRRLWILYALAAAYAASVIVFFVVARYRYPIVPYVALFAGAGLIAMPRMADTPGRHRIAAISAAVLAAGLAFWPLGWTADARRAITENNLGAALQEDGRIDQAIERYRRALAHDSGYTPALGNLGTALRAAGRTGEAIGVYEEALGRRPGVASVHYNLANALLADGRASEAAAHFERALAIDSRFVDAQNNLGLALDAQGRRAEAIAAWRRAVALDDRSAHAHGNLGSALASSGRPGEGIEHLRRAAALAPADPERRYDLGSVFLEGGAFAEAAAELAEAVRLRPGYAEAHNNLGIALASMGRVDEAVRHWQQALRLKPDYPDARRNLDLAMARQ